MVSLCFNVEDREVREDNEEVALSVQGFGPLNKLTLTR